MEIITLNELGGRIENNSFGKTTEIAISSIRKKTKNNNNNRVYLALANGKKRNELKQQNKWHDNKKRKKRGAKDGRTNELSTTNATLSHVHQHKTMLIVRFHAIVKSIRIEVRVHVFFAVNRMKALFPHTHTHARTHLSTGNAVYLSSGKWKNLLKAIKQLYCFELEWNMRIGESFNFFWQLKM